MKLLARLAVSLLIDSVDNGTNLQRRKLVCVTMERAQIISSVPFMVKLICCYKRIL